MDLNWTILIAVATSAISGIWTVYQYIEAKKREQNLKEFENYHKLIKELVQPDDSNAIYEDRQAAIIFELTHFKRYYAFSYRTMLGLREKWGQVPNQYPRLIDELDRSIKFLKKRI
ncbi:hypothetical protein RT717_09095 [Imperialibacter roseus]|uniref:DUF4760 domain-containing protein n=1 Tax=Imperialibacter roseus TaxID=1324217 RepID=A0ABZ0IUS0_9BACT|nr:hypothetical protein [Imperialibacter roseus]WOK08790.1 hypothetical protein RT717_09095 [Imperialibacter roseus]